MLDARVSEYQCEVHDEISESQSGERVVLPSRGFWGVAP